MTDRVEPPEGLRDRDGWHWLEAGMEPKPFKWLGGSPGCWQRPLAAGWRYVSPCLTSAEVSALRDERDAAVARAEALAAAVQHTFDNCCDEDAHDIDAESLRAALAAYRAASPKLKP